MLKKVIKNFIISVTAVIILSCSITVNAAPKTMADGSVFDAEFYAATYPDVVKALGTSEAALYQHYVLFGKNEGRLPFGNSQVQVSVQPQVAALPKNPFYIDQIAVSFALNDYATIQSLSANFKKHIKELAPFIVSTSELTTLYNFNTAFGELIINAYAPAVSHDEYVMIITMGLAISGHEAGDAAIAVSNAEAAKNIAVEGKSNWYCDKKTYGKDTLIFGDKWTEYVHCKNGLKYIEISCDGEKYGDLSDYQHNSSMRNQSTSFHFCYHN